MEVEQRVITCQGCGYRFLYDTDWITFIRETLHDDYCSECADTVSHGEASSWYDEYKHELLP